VFPHASRLNKSNVEARREVVCYVRVLQSPKWKRPLVVLSLMSIGIHAVSSPDVIRLARSMRNWNRSARLISGEPVSAARRMMGDVLEMSRATLGLLARYTRPRRLAGFEAAMGAATGAGAAMAKGAGVGRAETLRRAKMNPRTRVKRSWEGLVVEANMVRNVRSVGFVVCLVYVIACWRWSVGDGLFCAAGSWMVLVWWWRGS